MLNHKGLSVQLAIYPKLQFTALIGVSVIKTPTEEKKRKNKQTLSVLYVLYISIKIKTISRHNF